MEQLLFQVSDMELYWQLEDMPPLRKQLDKGRKGQMLRTEKMSPKLKHM